MRKILAFLCLVACLAFVTPAQAQMRGDVQTAKAPTQLYDTGGAAFSLNKLFSPAHFQMSHSYEMSMGSFGGGNSYSMGAYTNTLAWQFSDKLAARADVSFAFSPFGGNALGDEGGIENGRLFLRNAEIAYRPKENMLFHIRVQQSPYGSYMSPYGYHGYGYSPFGYDRFGYDSYGASADRLFWKDVR